MSFSVFSCDVLGVRGVEGKNKVVKGALITKKADILESTRADTHNNLLKSCEKKENE